jgi:copper chaperone CopZ
LGGWTEECPNLSRITARSSTNDSAMSDDMKVTITYDGVNTHEQIDALEQDLNKLEGVEVQQVGIDTAVLFYDHNVIDAADIERVIERVADTVRHMDGAS